MKGTGVNRWANWRDNLPLPALFGGIFVLWTGIRLVFVLTDGRRLTLSIVVIEVVLGLIFAGLMTGLIAWRRRRAGGASTFSEMNQAVRTGNLPEDAEPAVWAPELERRRRAVVRSRILAPVFFGCLVALAVVDLGLGGNPVAPVVALILFVAAGIVTIVTSRRALGRITSLQRQLDPRGR